MQHVYVHGGNLGNECADHAAAALGTFGLTSSHNVATRWIHHNFDASVCFDGCNNISEVLERLQHIRTDNVASPKKGVSVVFTIGFFVFEHNVWNPVLELFFLEQVSGISASYLVGNRPGQDRTFLSLCS